MTGVDRNVEPWLRETLLEVDAVRRQVLHSLEQTNEDVERWCGGLDDEQMHARVAGLAPVGFHLRHMVRSLDRLLTYAEGGLLDARQMALLASEIAAEGSAAETFEELRMGLEGAGARVRALRGDYEAARYVGRDRLKTTLGGLMVHMAEHTQRHMGQAIVTAKIVRAR